MKTVKKAILTTTFLLGILIAFLILGIGNMTGYAEATDSGEEYLYLVDGGSDVTVKRGETVSITVQRGDDIIIPILTLGNEDHHIEIEENRLSLLSDSYVGGEIIVFLSYLVEEEIVEIEEPLILLTAFEDDFAIDQAVTPDGYAMTGDFATATVKVNVAGSITDTTLQPQEDIYDILLSSGKDSYGNTEVSVASLDIVGRNGLNNEVVFTANNGENNLNIEPYATNSTLSGSGTSSSPYLINSEATFELINSYDSETSTVYFRQTGDISINGNTPLNTRKFYGYYDGDGYTLIRGGGMTYGAFCMTNKGTIKNLEIVLVADTSSPAYFAGILYVGGVCAYNEGLIDTVDVIENTTDINAYIQFSGLGFGGIAGHNATNSGVLRSNVRLKVHRINSALVDGGVVGANSGRVLTCSYGGIIKYDNLEAQVIGGIVGNNSGVVNFLLERTLLMGQLVVDFSNVQTPEDSQDRNVEAGWFIGRNNQSEGLYSPLIHDRYSYLLGVIGEQNISLQYFGTALSNSDAIGRIYTA